MSAELVPVENMAELETLTPEARDLAVTRMLEEARGWLAHAKEASEPARVISEFKAFIASAADAARRVKVSKEIQLDADEMVRRSERALGQAIREGQTAGEIRTIADGAGVREHLVHHVNKVSPKDFLSSGKETVDVYDLTDDVSDEQFEAAIDEAKGEQNLSRANVVRKVKNKKIAASPTGRSSETRVERGRLIRDLAERGYRSRQIADQVGVTEETVRQIARDFGIEIPADRVTSGARRIDSSRVARQTVTTLEGAATGLDLINYDDLDPAELADWATSLTESMRALNRFVKQIKEMAK